MAVLLTTTSVSDDILSFVKPDGTIVTVYSNGSSFDPSDENFFFSESSTLEEELMFLSYYA